MAVTKQDLENLKPEVFYKIKIKAMGEFEVHKSKRGSQNIICLNSQRLMFCHMNLFEIGFNFETVPITGLRMDSEQFMYDEIERLEISQRV